MTQLHPPIPFLEWFYDLELSPHPLKILQVPNAGDTLPPGAARPALGLQDATIVCPMSFWVWG